MRVFSPFFSSRLLFAAGTCALLVLIVVLVTGGFVIEAGPFRFSAHRWMQPLVVTVVAWLGAALYGRTYFRDAATSVASFLDSHATAGALVLATVTAAIGIAFGTYSASSADPSGYVSHAELLASGHFSRDEPLAREIDWPEPEWTFSPLGYRPGVARGEIVPGYPLGLPLTMVGARLVGGEFGPFLVTPFLGAVAVFCTYLLGMTLHSRIAGLIAAALLGTSPILVFHLVQPMSDLPAVAWWTLAFLFALAPGNWAAFAAGATAGIAFLTRPSLLPLAAAVALAVTGWARLRTSESWSRIWPFAAGVAPALGALALIQRRLYGSPVVTGYGDISDFFVLSNISTNIRDYSSRLLTGETASLALLACAVGVLITRSRPAVSSVRRAAWLAALVGGLTLAIYLPYGVFPDWSYLRFLLPAFPFAFVLVGALTVSAAARLPAPARGLILLIAGTFVCAQNVVQAEREQAFNLRLFEARYRVAGKYLRSALPSNAVIITSQESGSASHYAALPIVRWDLLNVDIDSALAALRTRGRHPVVLIEDWEVRAFRSKFSGSPIAQLDWPARAEFGDSTRVLLFDPADRDGRHLPIQTDRVH